MQEDEIEALAEQVVAIQRRFYFEKSGQKSSRQAELQRLFESTIKNSENEN